MYPSPVAARSSAALVLALLLVACDAGTARTETDAASLAADAASLAADAAALDADAATDAADPPWWDALPRAGWAQFERVELDADQDWFEVYRVAPGTWALYEPGQWQEITSWLIEGESRALLFDTGLGIGDIRALAEALTDRPLMVLNSHTHTDHTGGNHRFETILGPTSAWAEANSEGGTHAEAMDDFFAPGAVWMDLPEGFDRERFRTRPWSVGREVIDGQIIDLGGRRLEVLFTPGHAPDALCLLDADERILFTGDTFYPAPLYAHLPGSDFDAYLESARMLGGLAEQVDLVATGHNEPVADGAILTRLAGAFEAVASGRADYVVRDGVRVFDFGTFSIVDDASD